jgi:AraC family transcriptional regulator
VNTYRKNNPLSDSPLTVLCSSELLGWRDIVVEKRYHAGGDYVFPGSSSHLVCVNIGGPVSVSHVRNGRTFHGVISSGQAQILPAGGASSMHLQRDADHMHILLTPAQLQQVAEEEHHPYSELIERFRAYDTRIETISSALLTELLEGGPSGRLYVEGLTIALTAHLVHAYTSTPHDPVEITKGLTSAQLHKITIFIEDRLTQDLGITELSTELGLRPSHFSTLFRKATGLSPHAYIIRRRLEHAQHLIRTSKLSIGEIATAVGFYDQSHLVRQMRKVMGIIPSFLRDHSC